MTENHPTLLVTGSAGQLGRRVVEIALALAKTGGHKVVAGSRSPEKLTDLASKGAETRMAKQPVDRSAARLISSRADS